MNSAISMLPFLLLKCSILSQQENPNFNVVLVADPDLSFSYAKLAI